MRHFLPAAIWSLLAAIVMWLIASALTTSDTEQTLPDVNDVAADAIDIGLPISEAKAILDSHDIDHSLVEGDGGKSVLYFGWHELTVVDGKIVEKFDSRAFWD